jgi:hypothetical protein
MKEEEWEAILTERKCSHLVRAVCQGEHQEGGGCMIQGLLSNAHLLDDL